MKAYSLPLFPLNVVVCPEGLLPLRIFEARYLDMVRNCLRNKTSFGVVTVLPEGETDEEGTFPFAQVGTLVNIIDADVATVGLMTIRCLGLHRIQVESFTQQQDGLVMGVVSDIPNDLEVTIPEDLTMTSTILKKLIASFPAQGIQEQDIPVIEPFKFEDSAWVANRWVELLDLPLIEKQRLMQLDSAILRLELIQDLLDTTAPRLA